MRKYPLPLAMAAALWAASPALAQGTKPKPAPPQASKTDTSAIPGGSEVVGTAGGKPITWAQLVTRMQTESEPAFEQAIMEAVGSSVFEGLFGENGKPQVTITRAQALASLRKKPPKVILQALDGMLTEEALTQTAAKEGVAPTEALVNTEVKKLFDDARKQNTIPPGTTDDQFLASRKLKRTQIAARMRQKLQLLALAQKEIEKTRGRPFGSDDFYQARHILIQLPQPAPDAKPEDIKKAETEALAKITKISEDIKAGKTTFEKAATDNSDDPGSKLRGGDLGIAVRGVMVKPFEDAALSLKPGEMSAPVKTEFGYHLIKLEKAGKDISQADRQTALEQYETSPAQAQVTQQIVASLNSKIVNNLGSARPTLPGNLRPGRPGPRPGVGNGGAPQGNPPR